MRRAVGQIARRRRRNRCGIETFISVVRSESRFFPYGRRNLDPVGVSQFASGAAEIVNEGGRSLTMSALAKSLLLFALNWIDAQLTLLWIRTNIASEGNGLMNQLLKLGDAPFLLVKIAIGAFAAYILYRCAHMTLARRGMQLVLGIYLALMFVHVATGMSMLGWSQPLALVTYVCSMPHTLLTLLG